MIDKDGRLALVEKEGRPALVVKEERLAALVNQVDQEGRLALIALEEERVVAFRLGLRRCSQRVTEEARAHVRRDWRPFDCSSNPVAVGTR